MILGEFERQEGYDTDLNWQTKSRLDVLSAKGARAENGSLANGNGHSVNGSRFSLSSMGKKPEKQASLLPPELEMSHQQTGMGV